MEKKNEWNISIQVAIFFTRYPKVIVILTTLFVSGFIGTIIYTFRRIEIGKD